MTGSEPSAPPSLSTVPLVGVIVTSLVVCGGLRVSVAPADAISVESGHSSPSTVIAITGMGDEDIKKTFRFASNYAAP
jgi:hypothetical protein